MTSGRGGDRHPSVAAEAEGYLLARSRHDEALRDAEALCARLPWLTGAQADDLTRQYVRQHIDLSRRMLLAVLERADGLRQEYEQRYADLRRRLLKGHAAWACALLAGAAWATACLGWTTR
ncbi:hypothetical protein [Streptomyces fumanus]|uniref:Uncharacterized protein n=1 Tax=Streptomyces fumanus TaxID=67302 RepID=A0A919A5X9_9ACTN|nr:hypothetical protein [Streptomyces fumanus]GHE89290.1 hypothetical protein GCM10018772_11320 [Streptomyces fumanus]